MTDFAQPRPSRIFSVFLLFTLLSGFLVLTPAANAQSPTLNTHSGGSSRGVPTPSWLMSIVKGNESTQTPSKMRGAVPMDLTLNQKVNIKSQNGGNLIYYSPSEIRNTYNATSLLSSGYDGRGETISIVDAFGDPYIQGELDNFSSSFGMPSTTVNVICVDGPCDYSNGITTGWNGEIALDVEWAHAMAPGATINLYIGANSSQPLYDGVAAAVAGTNGNGSYYSPSSIISMSWGTPENDIGESGAIAPVFGENYPWLNEVFQQGVAQGITFFASTGDWGAYDQSMGQTSPYGGAIYPSTDPFVTAVGGTSLYMNTTSGYLQYPEANATGGYGYETGWSWNNQYGWGTGGGFSTVIGQPPWQRGPGVPSGATRGAPDVSWDADVLTGVLVYVNGGLFIYGGTSVGSPSWAGAMALIDERAGHNLGLINPSIYSILDNPSEYAKAFHDVTVGNNDPLQAGPAWDPLTGVGTPNIGELATYLAQPTTSLSVHAASSVALGTSASYNSVKISATVTGGGGTVTTGTGYALIKSRAGSVVANITVAFDPSAGNWTGTYDVQRTDPPGMWTATVFVTSGPQSGSGITTFSVGDGITIFASWGFFMVGDAIPIRAIVTNTDGTITTGGSFNATFYLGTPSGPVEGFAPLAFNSGDQMWEGSFLINSSRDQGAWVLSITGTGAETFCSSCLKLGHAPAAPVHVTVNTPAAPAYSWLNAGLLGSTFTDDPTYVLGNSILIASFIYNGPHGYYPSTGSYSARIWDNGRSLGRVTLNFNPNYGLWMGSFRIPPSDPTGFYNIVVTGNDGHGNSANGETLVRVASTSLNVVTSVSAPTWAINSTAPEILSAHITYPNGTLVTSGSVDAFTDYGYYLPMTYNSTSQDFVGIAPNPGVGGTYSFYVDAFDPLGNEGEALGSFIAVTPSVTILSCTGPVTVGQPSVCTAFVSGSVPTGNVSFVSSGPGAFFGGICELVGGTCSALYIPTSTSGSPQNITATYSGDAYNLPSVGKAIIAVGISTTVTSIICASDPVNNGTSTQCTAVVYGYSPTGTVAWSMGSPGTILVHPASCTLGPGPTCAITVSGIRNGSTTLTAAYHGDQNNLPSNGSLVVEDNNVAIACTPPSVVVGGRTTCTATVVGTRMPTGIVYWSAIWRTAGGSGRFTRLTCRLSGGSCTVGYSPASAGFVGLSASYGGDSYNPTSSGTFGYTVSQKTSKTTVSCTPTSVIAGSSKVITCGAVATGYKLGGTVTWTRSGIPLATCVLNPRGRCSASMTVTTAGKVTIRATYSGDINNAGSLGTATLNVRPAKTTLYMSCVSAWVALNSFTTCTATLTGFTDSVSNEFVSWSQTSGKGAVFFSSPACQLSSGGVCTVMMTGIGLGHATIKASYAGDANNLGSHRTERVTIFS